MTDLHVPRGQTVTLDVVDGELTIGHNATIQGNNGNTIIVTKGVYLEGKAYVNGSLECDSIQSGVFLSKTGELNVGSQRARLELTGRYVGKLEVTGSLTVHKQLNVSHTVEVTEAINAGDIDVGGKIEAGAVKCGKMRVGGRADIHNMLEASNVDIGGKVEALGTVKIGDLNVGGEAEVGGGSITGSIHVGGKFVSKSALEFGELLVYGRGCLPAGCKGHRISTFGKLEVGGDLTCDIIEAGGVIEINGNCTSQKAEVGGKFALAGAMHVSDLFKGCGSTQIDGTLECRQLAFSGKLTAEKIVVQEEADVSGKTEVKVGLKARLVTVRSGSRCEGALIGEQVIIGKSADVSCSPGAFNWVIEHHVALFNQAMASKGLWTGGGMARVDDVYGKEVVLGAMCRAARIFADKVKLEQGSAAEQVTYTDELKMDYGAAVSEPPIKADVLPKPPL
jgi:cytoskeletal protein CcmA (bactofilin family)